MSHHYFVSKLLKKIAIIVILIFCWTFQPKNVCNLLSFIKKYNYNYISFNEWFGRSKKKLLSIISCRCLNKAIYTDLFTLMQWWLVSMLLNFIISRADSQEHNIDMKLLCGILVGTVAPILSVIIGVCIITNYLKRKLIDVVLYLLFLLHVLKYKALTID